MSIFSDPISGTLGVILGHILQSRIWRMMRLGYAMGLAATIAFLIVGGGTLAAGVHVPIAIGSGMVSAGIAMIATYAKSPDAKDLPIALPQTVLDEEKAIPTSKVEAK